MVVTKVTASDQAEKLGSVLGIIWDDVVHEVTAQDEVLPGVVDLEKIAEMIVANRNILNGSTAAFKTQFETIRKSPWLTSNERRFAIAVALARHLAKRAIDRCETKQDTTANERKACIAIKKLQQDRRAPVLGAIILAPEAEFRKISSKFYDDALMVSSAFSIPLDAARLRIDCDKLPA